MNQLKNLPKVDKFVTTSLFAGLNLRLLTKIAQEEIEKLRSALLNGEETSVDEAKLAYHVKHRYDAIFQPSLRPLINATGVILHTNMGRSVISSKLLERASAVICNYSNLEYNLEKDAGESAMSMSALTSNDSYM